MIKPLLVSTSDIFGGAARAAYRLHQGLLSLELDSQIFVQNKLTDDYTVINSYNNEIEKVIVKARPTLDTLPTIFYSKKQQTPFHTQLLPNNSHQKINQLNADIVNLHWITAGFISIASLSKIKAPLVWTLHDMWAFTGGCHYNGDCLSYTESCGSCPQLGSNSNSDLSRQIWKKKHHSWQDLNLTIVTPSHWLADCAKKSSLFQNYRIETIPNGIDKNTYKPIEKKIAQNILNLPQDKKLILFGAVDATSQERKGFQYLISALEKLRHLENDDNFDLIVFGASEPSDNSDFPFKTNYLGKLNDDISLAILYSAVDVFVAPSIQDNLPNTVMEALACGVPCVAFKIGGMGDMIEHQHNGYLAKPLEMSDLAQGIIWVLENDDRHHKLSENARKTVEDKFTLKHQASKYLELYNSILGN